MTTDDGHDASGRGMRKYAPWGGVVAGLLVLLGVVIVKQVNVALEQVGVHYGVGTALQGYASEHGGHYPALSSSSGCLSIDESSLVPKYITQEGFAEILMREDAARRSSDVALHASGECLCEQQKYFYVAHMDFGVDLSDFEPQEAGGTVGSRRVAPLDDAAHAAALRFDVEVGAKPEDFREANLKPLLIRRVPLDVDAMECIVLFADGHVKYLDYPEDYPCTPEIMRALRRIEGGRCQQAGD